MRAHRCSSLSPATQAKIAGQRERPVNSPQIFACDFRVCWFRALQTPRNHPNRTSRPWTRTCLTERDARSQNKPNHLKREKKSSRRRGGRFASASANAPSRKAAVKSAGGSDLERNRFRDRVAAPYLFPPSRAPSALLTPCFIHTFSRTSSVQASPDSAWNNWHSMTRRFS